MMNTVEIFCKYDALVNPKSLLEHPKNRNKHPKDQVKRLTEMLSFYGFRHPIIVDADDKKTIIVGRGRQMASIHGNFEQVPVVYQKFTNEDQKYAFIQADNAISEWSQLDLASINFDLAELGPDFNIDMLGLKDFVIEPADKYENVDADAVPAIKKETMSKIGDVWKLGNHRLMCADSTSIDSLDKLMNGQKAEFLFTDPPYNQETDGGFSGNIGKALKKQSDEIEHLCNFEPKDFLNILPTIFNKNMNSMIFCNKDLVHEYLTWAVQCGYSYNILFWKKPSAIPIGGSYRPDVEYLLSFVKNGVFNSGIEDIQYSKCLEHKRVTDKVHPTMKPIEMIFNQIKIRSNINGVVVDLFGGSGSTLISCEKTNRNCYMMELDPKYCDIIIQRWQNLTGEKAVLLKD